MQVSVKGHTIHTIASETALMNMGKTDIDPLGQFI